MHAMKRSWIIWALVGLIAGGVLAWVRERRVDVAPGGDTAAATSSSTDDGSADLAARCREAASALAVELDDTFDVLVEPPFVLAGNMRKSDLKSHLEHSVLRPAEAMWRAYFVGRPDGPIVVLLLTDRGVRPAEDREPGYAYRGWSRRLFGDEAVSGFGYYKPDRRTLVMNIDTGAGTLSHELTHALIVHDFPHPPDWLNEALASLHEQCRLDDGELVGMVNWRLAALREAIDAGTLRPLAELVTQDDFRANRMGMNYAQARYFAMYMQHRGKLREFYTYYRDHREGGGVAAIEHVLGERIGEVEASYVAWVKGLRLE